jgi:hypothetical protein
MSRTPKALEAVSDKPTETPQLQQVTLLKAHTHDGRECAAGEAIDVDEPTRQWLIDNQVIEGEPTKAAEQEASA